MIVSSAQSANVNAPAAKELAITRLLRYQPNLPKRLHQLLSTVTTYLPRGLSCALMESPSVETLALPLEGTVMFADVDGFTALTERFSEMEELEGSEELTRLINSFLAILIEHTLPYGGDLQKFGGDAGLLLFTGENHALRATAAALAVHQAVDEELAEVETSLGTYPLHIATGLASGRMLGVGLGSVENRKWMLTGPPLTAMGHAQEVAPSEGIVADESLFYYCGDLVQSSLLAEGLHLIATDQELALERQPFEFPQPPAELVGVPLISWLLERLDALTPYLDVEFLTRIITLSSLKDIELWSEHRQVTILMLGMAALPELTAYWNHPKKLQQLVELPNELFVRARDCIQRYGGVVNKIGIGPQGPYLMGLFGAPQAHEDDPLRATLAALEMQENSEVPLRLGINSGFVFAGDVGTDERREYTVMGDAVNLAYRLKSSCKPGQVWLGPYTARHPTIRQRIRGVVGPPQQLKGKREPITPYIAQSLRSLAERKSSQELPLIGREEELSVVQQRLAQSAARNQTEVVCLHGAAGMGKSRLTVEMTRWAEEHEFQVHVGSAPSYGAHLPYAAWQELLRSLLGLEILPADEQLAVLQQTLSELGLEVWTALIAPLVGLSVTASPEVASLSTELRAIQRVRVLTALLSASARLRPQLLILENLQWMPATSRALLSGVLDNLSSLPLTILLTYRDDEEDLSAWLSSIEEAVVDLPLPALSRLEMAKLATQAAGGTLPRQIKRWVAKRGGGTPLFAIESVEALKMAGIIKLQQGEWELTQSLDEAPLPETTYGLIQSRIDQLDPPHRHLLRSATVVGEQMTVSMLVVGYGEEPPLVVRRRLSALNPFGLVYGDQEEETLFFQQPLTREVAYNGLPYRIRRLVHSRLSGYLDSARSTATSNWLTLLAYHSFEGQQWEVAVRANLDLGKHALDNYLTEQAVEALERAWEAIEAGQLRVGEECFEVHHLLGETLAILGQYGKALEHLERARSSLPLNPTTLTETQQLADIEYHYASVLESQGHYPEAFEAVNRGLALDGLAETVERARLYMKGAGLFHRQGDYEKEQQWAERSAKLAGNLPGEEAQKVAARSLYLLAYVTSLCGKPQEALSLGYQSMDIYHKVHDLLGEMEARNNLVGINMAVGNWTDAVMHGEQALAIAQRINHAEGEAKVSANLGELYRLQGRLSKARSAYLTALKIAQKLGIVYGEAMMENNLAAVALEEGRLEEAHERLESAEKLFGEIGAEGALTELYRHRGHLKLLKVELEAALSWSLHSLELAESQGALSEKGRTQLLLAEIYTAQGNCQLAQDAFSEARALLKETGDSYGEAKALLTEACFHQECGLPEKGLPILQQALEKFEELGAEGDFERAQLLLTQWSRNVE